MDNSTDMVQMPFSVHEAEMVRAERTQKRLFAVIFVLIFLLLATNVGWIIYEAQFEESVTTTQTVEQEAESGSNMFVGGDYNGKAESNDNNH